MHAPIFDDPLTDWPAMTCSLCSDTYMRQPTMAMALDDPYALQVSLDCETCGTRNHLIIRWQAGRLHIVQAKST